MCKCVSYRYLIPVAERQPEGNADALYAFKSGGFGGETNAYSIVTRLMK